MVIVTGLSIFITGEEVQQEPSVPILPMDILESRLDYLLGFIDKRYGPVVSEELSLSALAIRTPIGSPKPTSARKVRTKPVLVSS